MYRMYYRGRPLTGYGDNDPRAQEVTCYAESNDNITFTKPKLGLVSFGGNKDNNAILADVGHEHDPRVAVLQGDSPPEAGARRHLIPRVSLTAK
jgi:hypothetical protein